MKKSSAVIIWGILISWIFFLGIFFVWQWNLRPVDLADKQKAEFIIAKGESVSQISENLNKQGLVRDVLSFKILIFYLRISRSIQAGSFELSPSMSAKQIALSLTKGTNDLKLTIIEGLRQEQIGQALILKGLSFDIALWQQTIKQRNLEGKLFPDTYFFPKNADIESVLAIIDRNFQQKVITQLGGEIERSNFNLAQILTLASILEREVRFEGEREVVAGLLIKRWQNDWPLQADATVQYAVASRNFSRLSNLSSRQDFDWWKNNLAKEDLTIDSPYNTYKYQGLPPGSICNPGLSAIKAVLNFKDSPYWFYLTGKDGQTYFARTAEEHAVNIEKYLR